jgi:dipeptidyl aminopeptidase/acylaminoacyl peptidase
MCIAHELITVPNAEHGLAGADPEKVASAYQSAWDFVKRNLRPR